MKMKSLTLMLASVFASLFANAQNHWPGSGSAGIGTSTTPAERFEIRDGTPSYLKFTRTSDVLGPVGGIKFDVAGTEVGRIETERMIAENRLSAMKFLVRNSTNSSAVTEVMRLDHDGQVGIGISAPLARLHVQAPTGTRLASFTHATVSGTNATLDIVNATSASNLFIPCIRGRGHNPGHTFGLYFIGEAEDVAVPEAWEAAVILDGRTKAGAKMTSANVLAINSMGVNLAVVKADGSVGIGTPVTHGHKLAVNGSALFTKAVVKLQANWPDFVFEPEYNLRPLSELAEFIQINKHLPEIPTATEVARDGQDLGEMNRKLLQKVEELTLYIIEQDKARKAVESRLAEIEKRMENMK